MITITKQETDIEYIGTFFYYLDLFLGKKCNMSRKLCQRFTNAFTIESRRSLKLFDSSKKIYRNFSGTTSVTTKKILRWEVKQLFCLKKIK